MNWLCVSKTCMGVRELKKTEKISKYSCKLYLQKAIYFCALSFVQLSSHCFLYHSHPLALFSSIHPVFLSTLLPFSLAVSHFLLFLRLHSDCPPHFGYAFRSESQCSSMKIPFSSSICSFFVIYMLLAFIVLAFHFHNMIKKPACCAWKHTWKMQFQLTDNNQLYPF